MRPPLPTLSTERPLPSTAPGVQRFEVEDAHLNGQLLIGGDALADRAEALLWGGPFLPLRIERAPEKSYVHLPERLLFTLADTEALPPPAAFAIALRLAEALDRVHDNQVVHGHLHPDSIGFDALGRLRIAPALHHPITRVGEERPTAADDCLALGRVLAQMLGWAPPDWSEVPLDGVDARSARTILRGLLRERVRLRLSPARAVRQTLASLFVRSKISDPDLPLREWLSAQGLPQAQLDSPGKVVLPLAEMGETPPQRWVPEVTSSGKGGGLLAQIPPEPSPESFSSTQLTSPYSLNEDTADPLTADELSEPFSHFEQSDDLILSPRGEPAIVHIGPALSPEEVPVLELGDAGIESEDSASLALAEWDEEGDEEALEAQRLEAEQLETERVEAERAETERVEAERLEAEQLEAERVEAERIEAERVEAERVDAERVEAERLEAQRIEAEQLEEAERVEAERLEAARLEAERLEAERLEAERLEAERIAAERMEAEQLEAERLEAERVEAERIEAERVEAERLEAERLEAERVEAERLEAERLEAERIETDRLAAEAAALAWAEQSEAERVETARLETERLEAKRLADEEEARIEAERAEEARIEAERAEEARIEAERAEEARIEAERLEAQRIEAQRIEAERVESERVEAERVEAERVEAERVEAERVEAERVEAERVEAERVEAERVEAERIEAQRIETERAEAERIEVERLQEETELEQLFTNPEHDDDTPIADSGLLAGLAGTPDPRKTELFNADRKRSEPWSAADHELPSPVQGPSLAESTLEMPVEVTMDSVMDSEGDPAHAVAAWRAEEADDSETIDSPQDSETIESADNEPSFASLVSDLEEALAKPKPTGPAPIHKPQASVQRELQDAQAISAAETTKEIPAPPESILERQRGQSPAWGDADLGVGRDAKREDELGDGKWSESGRSAKELADQLPSSPVRDMEIEGEDSGGRALLIGLVVAALLLAGLLWVLMGPKGGAPITLQTHPAGLRVSVDGEDLGKAPAQYALPEGQGEHRVCAYVGEEQRCQTQSRAQLRASNPAMVDFSKE